MQEKPKRVRQTAAGGGKHKLSQENLTRGIQEVNGRKKTVIANRYDT